MVFDNFVQDFNLLGYGAMPVDNLLAVFFGGACPLCPQCSLNRAPMSQNLV